MRWKPGGEVVAAGDQEPAGVVGQGVQASRRARLGLVRERLPDARARSMTGGSRLDASPPGTSHQPARVHAVDHHAGARGAVHDPAQVVGLASCACPGRPGSRRRPGPSPCARAGAPGCAPRLRWCRGWPSRGAPLRHDPARGGLRLGGGHASCVPGCDWRISCTARRRASRSPRSISSAWYSLMWTKPPSGSYARAAA